MNICGNVFRRISGSSGFLKSEGRILDSAFFNEMDYAFQKIDKSLSPGIDDPGFFEHIQFLRCFLERLPGSRHARFQQFDEIISLVSEFFH